MDPNIIIKKILRRKLHVVLTSRLDLQCGLNAALPKRNCERPNHLQKTEKKKTIAESIV